MKTNNNTNNNHLFGKTLFVILLLGLCIFLFGCNQKIGPGSLPHVENQTMNQSTPPVNFTEVTPIILNNVVDANNMFALDLFSRYDSNDNNLFYSPYSIESALAMTYEGAKGQTAQEMQAVLHLPNDAEKIHSDFAGINSEINAAGKPYALTVANALWAQNDYPFIESYLSNVDKYYGGKVTNLDFKTQTEKSRITINDWVAGKTNDRIRDLLPKGVITGATRLVLTNAIYFKANWTYQFRSYDTRTGDFILNSGKTVKANMMHQTNNCNYTEDDDAQILEMNYLGNDLSMIIILPKENRSSDVEKALSVEKIAEWKNNMKFSEVQLTMPKFKFETTYYMSSDLQAMGMPTAFNAGNADFTGMYIKNQAAENLYISQVVHKTYLEVAEYGTEAAAATAVMMSGAGMPVDLKYFKADHPFIFIIQQKGTGNILFMGKLNDPTK